MSIHRTRPVTTAETRLIARAWSDYLDAAPADPAAAWRAYQSQLAAVGAVPTLCGYRVRVDHPAGAATDSPAVAA